MTTHIALLRGINIGRHNRVGMAALRELLHAAGYGDVRTHLQSGNVVLNSEEEPARLAVRLADQLRQGLELDVDVVVRTREEMGDVLAREPFGRLVTDPKLYQVSFLSNEPATEVAAGLEGRDLSPERVHIHGREIYAWHPNGIQRSPLAKLLTDRRLGVTATARNWNTITRLLALADE